MVRSEATTGRPAGTHPASRNCRKPGSPFGARTQHRTGTESKSPDPEVRLAARSGLRASALSGLWGLRPPGASRCCARASLRTPSRPHPPRPVCPPSEEGDTDTVDGEPAGPGGGHHSFGMREVEIGAEGARSASGEAPSSGGGGGKECAARHERSNDWPQGARSAPLTRTQCAPEPDFHNAKPCAIISVTDRHVYGRN